MEKKIFGLFAVALAVIVLGAPACYAGLAVPGDYQIANGGAGNWDPPNAPVMTDLTGGLFELPLTGLTASTRFLFKVLDDGGTPPAAWSDPEVPDNGPGSPNNWFQTDAGGAATIMLDRNTYSDGYLPTKDRITVSTDSTELPNLFATGSWMNEAGGTADWVNNDPLFQLVDQGGGLWTADVTISTPGTYEWKATAGSWDYQWGANGRNSDASNFQFITVAADQDVSFLLDLGKGAISYNTETFLPGDTNNNGVIELTDFYPIRDNWLNATFLRVDGNLDNTGDSEGVVDITDFRQWKTACTLTSCTTAAGMAAAIASLGASVPEPGSIALALVAGIGLLAGVRKR
jgi:hypothetical protein